MSHLLFDSFAFFNGFNGPSTHVSIAPVRPFIVVVVKPLIQILLQFLDRSIKLLSEGFSEELVEDRAVEFFYESIGPWSGNSGPAVLNIGEVQKDLIGVYHWFAAVLPAVICEDMPNHKAMILVKGQYPVIENIHRCFRKLGGVKFPEGEGPVGIHHRLEVDTAYALKKVVKSAFGSWNILGTTLSW